MKKFEKALIFKIDNNNYSIDSDSVIQILRIPEITKIPFTPEALRGLCSIEGHIIPAFDIRGLVFNNSETLVDMQSFKSRVLTIKYKNLPVALIVEEVVQNLDMDNQKVEYEQSIENSSVIGIIQSNQDIIQILSIDKLLENITMPELNRKEKNSSNKKSISGASISENQDYEKYLLFEMDDEKFAIEIDSVREIIVNTDNITTIANSSEDVVGMITLRDEVLVVIDLRKNFNKRVTFSDKNRVLIISDKSVTIGLLIDKIIDIKDIFNKSIEKLPEKFRDVKVSGVVKIGEELISILSNKYIKELVSEKNSSIDESTDNKAVKSETGNFIEIAIFSLGNEEFAIDIEDIDEIIRYEGITPIPKAPKFVKGIINLRGEVIPIVSLQERLNFKDSISEDTKILVSSVKGMRLGFLVDDVNEVSEISLEFVTQTDESNKTFSDIIILNSGERMILKISIDEIFSSENIDEISDVIGS